MFTFIITTDTDCRMYGINCLQSMNRQKYFSINVLQTSERVICFRFQPLRFIHSNDLLLIIFNKDQWGNVAANLSAEINFHKLHYC